MEYEQFIIEEKNQCDNSDHIRIALFVVTLIELTINCFRVWRTSKKNEELETENRSLKRMIFNNIDNAFVRIMKNGNRFEHDHEE